MNLDIKNRLNFGIFFPAEGNLFTQILIKGINDKIEVTSDEASEIELKQMGTQLTWNSTKAKEKFIQFNEAEVKFLKEQVERLDKESKITQDNLSLCVLIQEYGKAEEVEKKAKVASQPAASM